ncbi:helix-turn-helix domain-containing protein [Xenorhabdus cabanillasii]|uniref:Transcriptional regulator, XRE family n=1 Tax=Xenorhabdus cabanillasii JM26 TaxID=1427517 RepID=W1J8Q4_9GAMM|nr:helix-turn-helix transcriptional regulator [Xenorhabdus cabanillasii]PHM75385.1 transcriptional regulator [Xenorhabdus cabanillasii JM26]CDL85875.1 Transcriptional regulator, XRE family [Xenorhabdus cabanillasii JM26]
MSLGSRIKEERKKLNLTQVQFASVGGVQPTTQVNYEKGTRTPDAEYLEKIAIAGCDVLYILTGHRTPQSEISHEEQKLIEHYRAMSEESRLNMQAVGASFAQSAPNKQAKNG